MGVKHVKHLCMDHRDESPEDPRLGILADATAVFFTGGDQLRITTRLGGTALSERIGEIYRQGGILAGTSAGAAALREVVLVGRAAAGMCQVPRSKRAPGLARAVELT